MRLWIVVATSSALPKRSRLAAHRFTPWSEWLSKITAARGCTEFEVN